MSVHSFERLLEEIRTSHEHSPSEQEFLDKSRARLQTFWQATHSRTSTRPGRREKHKHLIFCVLSSVHQQLGTHPSAPPSIESLVTDVIKKIEMLAAEREQEIQTATDLWAKENDSRATKNQRPLPPLNFKSLDVPDRGIVKRYAKLSILHMKFTDELTIPEWKFLIKWDKNYVHRAYNHEDIVRSFPSSNDEAATSRRRFATTVCDLIETAMTAMQIERFQASDYYQILHFSSKPKENK